MTKVWSREVTDLVGDFWKGCDVFYAVFVRMAVLFEALFRGENFVKRYLVGLYLAMFFDGL